MIRMTFRSEGPGPPEPVRWKKLLKAALRGYGLRCVDLEEVPDRKGDDAPEAGGLAGIAGLADLETLGGR